MTVLRQWFSGITTGESPLVPGAPAVLEEPDHAVTLTWLPDSGDPHDIVVTGPRTTAGYRPRIPGRSCLRLPFRPGRAAAFLGLSLRDLTDRAASAADLDSEPLTRLVEAIAAGPVPRSHPERLRALARALPVALPVARPDHTRTVADAIALLSGADAGRRRVPVHGVAEELHISERHLRNLFADATGLTPARFVRIDRVRQVLARLGGSLPEIAAATGYFDQSHMTAEFRRVMGATPHAFATRRWPAAQACPSLNKPGPAKESPGEAGTGVGEVAR